MYGTWRVYYLLQCWLPSDDCSLIHDRLNTIHIFGSGSSLKFWKYCCMLDRWGSPGFYPSSSKAQKDSSRLALLKVAFSFLLGWLSARKYTWQALHGKVIADRPPYYKHRDIIWADNDQMVKSGAQPNKHMDRPADGSREGQTDGQ